MQQYQDHVTDQYGNAQRGASVLVKTAAGATATIYSDDGVTAKDNPITTGASGAFDFYAANGSYVLNIDGVDSTRFTLLDVTEASTATPTSASTVVGETGGVVKRFAVDDVAVIVSVKRYGAGVGAADDSTDIQEAIDAVSAAGGGMVYFPAGTYNYQLEVTPKSNVHLRGEGKQSLLKVNSASAFYIFNTTAASLVDVEINGLGFDGSLNYPADSTTYKTTLANANTAIRLATTALSNVKVKGCYFTQFSNQSIDINVDGASDVEISGNYFYKGSYKSCVILCRTPSAASASTRLRGFKIIDNTIDTCGPQLWYDPSKEDYVSSSDAIQIDKGKDCVVALNRVKNSGGVGIRIEQSDNVTVAGNTVVDSGQDAILFYKQCFGGSCTGNTVTKWGRTPQAFCIRNYGGTYVVAREFPKAAGPTLPADPTASTWFETWPYTTTGINTASIIAYSATDYYTTGPSGILPFRGYAAISVVQDSEAITVAGNSCTGDTTTSAGKYVYASDFGFTTVHSVNDSAALTAGVSGRNCVVVANTFADIRNKRIYHPAYQDRINSKGEMGRATYLGNYDSTSTIDRPNAWISDAGIASFSQVVSTGAISAYNATAIPSGGTRGVGFVFSSTADFGIFFGSGAPTLTAAKSSLYLRADGSATNNRAYINTDGGTTWTALTTAA